MFSVKGFGTVATGTLISGSVAKEQEVEVYPAGRRLRVRGVQVHGSTAGRAVAGQRTAVNLADIEPAELARGDVLSEPGRFQAVKQIDCRLDLLASAKPLKHRAPVHFHSGTAEIEAEVRLLEGTTAMRPGSTAYVRLILREAALLLPGDRFIIRMFSPVVTIGGGVVVDTGGRRYRKGDDVKARLDTLGAGDAAARIALLVREAGFGMGMAELVARTGMSEREIAAAAAEGSGGGDRAAAALVCGPRVDAVGARADRADGARVSPEDAAAAGHRAAGVARRRSGFRVRRAAGGGEGGGRRGRTGAARAGTSWC